MLSDGRGFQLATGVPRLNDPPIVRFVDLVVERVYKRNPGWVGDLGGGSYWATFVPELSAVTVLGVYAPGELRARSPDLNYTVSWVPHVNGRKAQELAAHGLGIPVGSEHPVEALRLIEFLVSDVETQMFLLSAVGFVGPGIAFLGELAQRTDDEALRWYIRSVDESQVLVPRVVTPQFDIAATAFAAAVESSLLLDKPVNQALEEANRITLAELRSRGYLP